MNERVRGERERGRECKRTRRQEISRENRWKERKVTETAREMYR